MTCRTGVAATLLVMAGSTAWAGEQALEMGAPLAHEALEAQRGGESHFELNIQETKATLEKNAAIGNATGANSIGGGSFAGASGFPVAVQNSGNNVIVQNAFIINLDVR